MSRRRTARGVGWEIGLTLILIVVFYLLVVSGALAEFGRWFGETMAEQLTRPSP